MSLILAAVLLLNGAASLAAAESVDPSEKKYLSLKGQGLYDMAMEALFSWTLKLADPAMMELNLFRIDELIDYPEQFGRALEIYAALENTSAFRNSYEPRKRLMLLKQKLLLRMGRLSEAQKIKEGLHFLDFRVIGPFQSGSVSDFEKERPVMKALREKSSLRGKNYPVSWFSAVTGRGGSIDMDELLPDTEGGLFYFYRPLRIEKPGTYRLSIGKNGFCDVMMDGLIIFRNRQRHGYSPDQYFADLNLPAGRHELLIRTDGTEKSLKLSCRLDFLSAGDRAGLKVVSRGYWGAAGKLPRGKEAASLFRRGYIFHAKEMNSRGDSRTVKICSGWNHPPNFIHGRRYTAACRLNQPRREKAVTKIH